MTTFFVVLAWLLIRIVLPLLLMTGLVYLLRHLDAQWQAEALYRQKLDAADHQEHSWDLTNCSINGIAHNPALHSVEPCWQALRKNNGRLHEECLSCKVFRAAPILLPN